MSVTTTAPAKKKKKRDAYSPRYKLMIAAAMWDRGACSRVAILRYILDHFFVGFDIPFVNRNIKMTLKAGVKNGTFKQISGTGARGTFMLAEKKTDKPRAIKPKGVGEKPASKEAKAATKKPKSPAEKGAKSMKVAKPPAKVGSAKKVAKTPAKKVAKTPAKEVAKTPAKKMAKTPDKMAKTPAKKTAKTPKK